MAQNFPTINSTDTIKNSRQPLIDRTDAAASNFSGTAFPTTNLIVGMMCYRTDQNKLYELKSTGPDTWVLLIDLSGAGAVVASALAAPWSGITGKPTTLAGYGVTDAVNKTGDTTTGKIAFKASDASGASIRILQGSAAPSSPVLGDAWFLSSSLYFRMSGITHEFSFLGKDEVYSGKKTFMGATGSTASFNIQTSSGFTTAVDGDVWFTGTLLRIKVGGVNKSIAFTDGTVDNVTGTVAVGNGGTGATGASGARSNLDAAQLGAYDSIRSISANDTTVANDRGKALLSSGATDITITIAAEASVNYPVGTRIPIIRGGSGEVTIAIGGADTLNSKSSMRRIDLRYGEVCATKTAAGTWVLTGDLKV
jgi:hypothetical protein